MAGVRAKLKAKEAQQTLRSTATSLETRMRQIPEQLNALAHGPRARKSASQALHSTLGHALTMESALAHNSKMLLPKLAGPSQCKPVDPKKCPTGRPNANWCYASGMRMQKFGGGVKAKDWCNKRTAEGCGCQWVAEEKPYSKYNQDKSKDKGNYGYCCYTSCTSIGNKGNQCCACAAGGGNAVPGPKTCEACVGTKTSVWCKDGKGYCLFGNSISARKKCKRRATAYI